MAKKNPSAQTIKGWQSSILPHQKWTEYLRSVYVKDFSKNQLTDYIQTAMYIPDYQYTEEIPTQDWEISDDTLTVVGYLCQKATCRFRGRDFTAWFTTEIPINNGPWKFGGLPGLIMKVYDSDNLFLFECVKIENQPYKIYLADYGKFGKVSENNRDKLLKLIKDSHEDWPRTAGIKYLDDSPLPPRSQYIYRPLELE